MVFLNHFWAVIRKRARKWPKNTVTIFPDIRLSYRFHDWVSYNSLDFFKCLKKWKKYFIFSPIMRFANFQMKWARSSAQFFSFFFSASVQYCSKLKKWPHTAISKNKNGPFNQPYFNTPSPLVLKCLGQAPHNSLVGIDD